ncbi:hypothetical protein [Methylobacterium sp. WL19]|uniref:hypothetical protein n=1 Tax=Methylobacterium sp. WL19 TaxID=2603896 RepID=UPI0011C84D9A|nr:hypothetical protein [Methylobacterium sp. WL19]TXN26872.1 hypothetical protein FV220_13615 [Methylobacterium sp. WL19]
MTAEQHPVLTLFLAEAESGKATTRSLAVLYALIIAGGDHVLGGDWRRVNEAVNAALGFDLRCAADVRRVDRFRKMAWAIHDAAGERQAFAGPAISHRAPEAVQ